MQEALRTGVLARERYASYMKLQRELAHLERKADAAAQREERARWKQVAKTIRSMPKVKR